MGRTWGGWTRGGSTEGRIDRKPTRLVIWLNLAQIALLTNSIFYVQTTSKMAEAGNDAVKGREKNSGSDKCLGTVGRSTEHTASRDTHDARLSDVSQLSPTSKNETETGVCVGVASVISRYA